MSESKIDDRAALSPVCTFCKHLKSTTDMTCKAFPIKIPRRIWSGKVKHKKHVVGDRGVKFEWA